MVRRIHFHVCVQRGIPMVRAQRKKEKRKKRCPEHSSSLYMFFQAGPVAFGPKTKSHEVDLLQKAAYRKSSLKDDSYALSASKGLSLIPKTQTQRIPFVNSPFGASLYVSDTKHQTIEKQSTPQLSNSSRIQHVVFLLK